MWPPWTDPATGPIRALQGNLTGIAYAEVPDGSTS